MIYARLEYLLKKSAFLNAAFNVIGKCVFGVLCALIRGNRRTILFTSFQGRSSQDSPFYILRELRKRPEFRKYRYVWGLRAGIQPPSGCEGVRIDSLAYFWEALNARYWVTNVNIERGLGFKPRNTFYVSTWHGTPIKRIGNDLDSRSDFDWSIVDLACVVSDYELSIFQSAFGLDQKKTKIVRSNPRHTILFEQSNQGLRSKLCFHESASIILYAPTWRESDIISGESELLIDVDEFDRRFKGKAVLLVKRHVIGSARSSEDVLQLNRSAFDVSGMNDFHSYLSEIDVLISDYSGFFFDYSFFDKPMLAYAPDQETYGLNRGLYNILDFYLGADVYTLQDSLFERIGELIEGNSFFVDQSSFRSRFINFDEYSTIEVVDHMVAHESSARNL